MLSRNVEKDLPICDVQQATRAHISYTLWQKPEIRYGNCCVAMKQNKKELQGIWGEMNNVYMDIDSHVN